MMANNLTPGMRPSTIGLQRLSQTNTNAGKADPNTSKAEGTQGARNVEASGKKATPQIQASIKTNEAIQKSTEKANTFNFAETNKVNATQQDAIKNFQASLGQATNSMSFAPASAAAPTLGASLSASLGAGTTPLNLGDASSTGTFNLAQAQGALKEGAINFSTDLSKTGVETAGQVQEANAGGGDALSILNTAGELLGGGVGKIISGGATIAIGVPMTSNPLTATAGWGMVAAGTLNTTKGFGEVFQGDNKVAQGEAKSQKTDAEWAQIAATLEKTGAQTAAMKTFYQGTSDKISMLGGVQNQNNLVLASASKIDSSIQAPPPPAGGANPAGGGTPVASATGLGATGLGGATSSPSTGGASWPPASPAPASNGNGAVAQGNGNPATGLSNTFAQPQQVVAQGASPQQGQGGLTEAETLFMQQFQANSGKGTSATAQAKTVLTEAPQGMNTGAIAATLKVGDVSQDPQLKRLFESLQAKASKNRQEQGVPPQFAPVAQAPMAPQGQVAKPQDPNAPKNGQDAKNAQDPKAVAKDPKAPNAQGQVANNNDKVAQANDGSKPNATPKALSIPTLAPALV